MTHDELLERIIACKDETELWLFRNSLRAVVELHKPNYGLCKACTTSLIHIAYPCLTIQAIEKELV